MDIFGTKPCVKPFGKMSIFRLFELFSYILNRHFLVLECHRGHFRGLYCPKKKKLEKWPFLAKTMAQPFWKNVNCSTFLTSCFL